ncbi:C-X-C chemokine receptor type 5 [Tiliqua scincoides]|uniref:C-X-C chemokine receptor type 5 n=1 Tax=Tiliqua scincoides TaxID=71010 RepID=UPI003462DB00
MAGGVHVLGGFAGRGGEGVLPIDYYNGSENDGNFSDDYLCPEGEDGSAPSFKILVPVYLLIFLLGALGNLLVLVILWRYRHSRTSTELFLFHLALANLLLVLTFPFGVVESLAGWIFGTFLCKLLSATNRITFYSSSLLLGCISVDRYLAVVYAVRTFRKQRVLSVHLTCLVVWVASLLLTLPDLLFTEVWPESDNLSICHFKEYGMHASNAWLATRFLYHIVGFFLPSVLMCYCYAAIVRVLCQSQRLQRRKAVKVAILVTGVFLLCWSPYHVVIFWDTLLKLEASKTSCMAKDDLGTAIMVCEMVGFSHCYLNPILYAFVGVRFRHDACRVLHDLGCLSQVALQNILGTSRTDSSSETNVSVLRHPTFPRSVSLLAASSDLPGPWPSSQDSAGQVAQGESGGPNSSPARG